MEDQCEGFSDENQEISPILIGELEQAAESGNALAHFALALTYASCVEEDGEQVGSAHWFEQEQQGEVLTGVQKEWADAHRQRLENEKNRHFHLNEAARLGIPEAMLETADRWGDDAFFAQNISNVRENPTRVANIAERMGRLEDAKAWLTVAAKAGDTDAMRRLIDGYDSNDLRRCWTWFYFAQMLGTDFTESHCFAITEDGTDYDDDIGGPAYVAGDEGLELDRLNAEQDEGAQQEALRLFSLLPDNKLQELQ